MSREVVLAEQLASSWKSSPHSEFKTKHRVGRHYKLGSPTLTHLMTKTLNFPSQFGFVLLLLICDQ